MSATSQYLDGVGFLSIGKAANKMNLIATLSDLTLSYEVTQDEVTSFASAFNKERIPTFKDWSIDGTAFADSSTTIPASMQSFSGSTNFTGVTATLDLISLAQAGQLVNVTVKLASNKYYRGNAVITKADVKSSVGKAITFSLSLQGSGALTISAT